MYLNFNGAFLYSSTLKMTEVTYNWMKLLQIPNL